MKAQTNSHKKNQHIHREFPYLNTDNNRSGGRPVNDKIYTVMAQPFSQDCIICPGRTQIILHVHTVLIIFEGNFVGSQGSKVQSGGQQRL